MHVRVAQDARAAGFCRFFVPQGTSPLLLRILMPPRQQPTPSPPSLSLTWHPTHPPTPTPAPTSTCTSSKRRREREELARRAWARWAGGGGRMHRALGVLPASYFACVDLGGGLLALAFSLLRLWDWWKALRVVVVRHCLCGECGRRSKGHDSLCPRRRHEAAPPLLFLRVGFPPSSLCCIQPGLRRFGPLTLSGPFCHRSPTYTHTILAFSYPPSSLLSHSFHTLHKYKQLGAR